MKRRIAIVVIVSIILCFLCLVAGIIRKTAAADKYAERIRTMPQFSLPTIDGGRFNSLEISAGPLLIIYFHPDCDHCNQEISSILGNSDLDREVKVILVSYARDHQIRSFIYSIEKKCEAGIWILVDTTQTFRDIFGSDVIPSNYVYNKELELVKAIKGETRTETILKYLGNGN